MVIYIFFKPEQGHEKFITYIFVVVGSEVFYDEIFQVAQFFIYMGMLLFKRSNRIISFRFILYHHFLHVRKDCFLFIINVLFKLFFIILVELNHQFKAWIIGSAAFQELFKLKFEFRHNIVDVISMSSFQVFNYFERRKGKELILRKILLIIKSVHYSKEEVWVNIFFKTNVFNCFFLDTQLNTKPVDYRQKVIVLVN